MHRQAFRITYLRHKQMDECFPVVTDLQSGAPQRPVSTQIARHS